MGFNFYAEYIMRNAGLEDAEAGIKIAGRNISNLTYTDDTTLMAESKEELRSLLIKVREESEKAGSKLSKPGFNSTWTVNFQMFKLDLEKAEEPEIKLPTSAGSSKKARVFQKKHLLLLYWPPQLCGSQQTGKLFKRWEYQTTWLTSWEICVQVKKQQLELDMEQQTGSK